MTFELYSKSSQANMIIVCDKQTKIEVVIHKKSGCK